MDRFSDFSHDSVRFPLTGRHVPVSCTGCHTPVRALTAFADAPETCVGCHRPDDSHRGEYGTDCAACHNTGDWNDADFDHTFPLDHGGQGVIECRTCHVEMPGFRTTPVSPATMRRRCARSTSTKGSARSATASAATQPAASARAPSAKTAATIAMRAVGAAEDVAAAACSLPRRRPGRAVHIHNPRGADVDPQEGAAVLLRHHPSPEVAGPGSRPPLSLRARGWPPGRFAVYSGTAGRGRCNRPGFCG